jgi:hypothetical protein
LKIQVYVKMGLRRIYGCKKEEVTGGWRKLHKEELHDCVPYILTRVICRVHRK